MSQSNPILVKFRASEHFINIRTVTRKRKSPQSFDLSREQFTELEASGHIIIRDGNSFADIRLIEGGSKVKIEFNWLSRHGDNSYTGFAQDVTLDYNTLADHIWDSLDGGPVSWSTLSTSCPQRRPRLDFSSEGAQRTIREVLAVPVLRHKLTRAIRDSFQWPHDGDHVVIFYADWDRYSFFFQEYMDGREGICGGLILHHHDGLAKSKYSVHT